MWRFVLVALFGTGLIVALTGGSAHAEITGLDLTARCGDTANQLQAKNTRDTGVNAIVTGQPGDVELPRLNVPPGGEAAIDVGKFQQVTVNAGRQQQTVSFDQCARSATTVASTSLASLAAAGQTGTTVTTTPIAAVPAVRLATTGATTIGYCLRLAAASFALGLACMFVTQRRRFQRIDAWLTWLFNSF